MPDATRSGDEEAVRALVVAYAERLDAGDFDGVAALFEHGAFRSARGGPDRVGRSAVRAMYDSIVVYDDGTPRTKHVLGNLLIDVADDRRTAGAQCTFTVLQSGADGLRPVLAGRYHDRFERVDDVWRFTERLVLPDLYGDLALHMRAPT